MKPARRSVIQRARYRFDNTISRGTLPIIGYLAVLTFEVTLLDDHAPVAISSQILNRQDGEDEYHVRSKAMGEGHDPRKSDGFDRRVLEPKHQWGDADQGRVELGFRCADSGMTLAVAAEHILETDNEYTTRVQVEDDLAKVTYRINAQPGQKVRLLGSGA